MYGLKIKDTKISLIDFILYLLILLLVVHLNKLKIFFHMGNL